MKHKTELSIPLEPLIEEIGNLRYDSLTKFLELLSTKIQNDGIKDLKKDRKQLATSLLDASFSLKTATTQIHTAWEICKNRNED